MELERLPGHYGRTVELDACHHCNVLWFDRLESTALGPRAVVTLVRDMHERHQEDLGPLAERLRCPRCRSEQLFASHRLVKSTRYRAWACRGCGGHLITFYEFLREKGMLAEMSPAQLDELRKHVTTVSCSNCGAGVEVERDSACSFCGSAIALLDPDALGSALGQLEEKLDREADVDGATAAVNMIFARLETERNFRVLDRIAPDNRQRDTPFGQKRDTPLAGVRRGVLEVAMEVLLELLTDW